MKATWEDEEMSTDYKTTNGLRGKSASWVKLEMMVWIHLGGTDWDMCDYLNILFTIRIHLYYFLFQCFNFLFVLGDFIKLNIYFLEHDRG